MFTWLSRLAQAALLIACVWQTSQLAAAQHEPGAARLLQSDDYGAVLRAAESAFQAQNFAESRALYVRAHTLEPSARTLRGIGSASFALQTYDDAVVHLEQALASTARPLDGELRKETRTLLERAYGFVGRYMVGLTPASAQVWVDEVQTALRTRDRLLLSIGGHAVEARAPGYEMERRSIEVVGGEDVELSFALMSSHAVATPAQAAQTVASDGADSNKRTLPDVEHEPGRPLYKNPWLWTGVGVVVAAIVVTVGVLAARDGTRVGAVSSSPNTPLGGTISAPLRSR